MFSTRETNHARIIVTTGVACFVSGNSGESQFNLSIACTTEWGTGITMSGNRNLVEALLSEFIDHLAEETINCAHCAESRLSDISRIYG